jgi:hypothetical protein
MVAKIAKDIIKMILADMGKFGLPVLREETGEETRALITLVLDSDTVSSAKMETSKNRAKSVLKNIELRRKMMVGSATESSPITAGGIFYRSIHLPQDELDESINHVLEKHRVKSTKGKDGKFLAHELVESDGNEDSRPKGTKIFTLSKAEGEADHTIASLCKEKRKKARPTVVLSTDTDYLLFSSVDALLDGGGFRRPSRVLYVLPEKRVFFQLTALFVGNDYGHDGGVGFQTAIKRANDVLTKFSGKEKNGDSSWDSVEVNGDSSWDSVEVNGDSSSDSVVETGDSPSYSYE